MLYYCEVNDFRTWLEQKYVEWIATRKKRGTIKEFSDELGIDQRLVANWMNGVRRPGPENARSLALKFGLEAYDVLSLPRPDPELFRIEAVWEALPDQERIRLANLAEDLAGHARAGEPVRLGKAPPLKKARA